MRIFRLVFITLIVALLSLLLYKKINHNLFSRKDWSRRVNAQTSVRFFYLPENSYAHPPLIFRIADKGDKRLGTAPIVNMGGRTPFISDEEMRNLIETLEHAGVRWEEASSAQPITNIPPKEVTNQMTVSVFLTDRPFEAHISPPQLCSTLSSLDSSLKQPRALWEFQLYRLEYGCDVKSFDRSAYPQHDGAAPNE